MGWLFGKKDKTISELKGMLLRQSRISAAVNMLSYGQIKFPDWSIQANAERYARIDDLYSIINRIATACAGIPIYPFYNKNKEQTKRLKRLGENTKPYERKAIQLKALEDLPETDAMYKLLAQPMKNMGRTQYYKAIVSFYLTHGELVILKQRGAIKGEVKELHPLYNQHVNLLVTATYPQKIVGYQYVIDGQIVMDNIPPEDIIHITSFNPFMTASGDELRGFSPQRALHSRLNRIASNMEISTARLKNGGVPTVLYDESLIDNGDAGDLIEKRKINWYNYLSKPENKGSAYWAVGKIGKVETGLSSVDMELLNLEKVDFKKLCNLYMVSDTLFNNDSASTESNVKEMRKAFYTDACLPIIRLICEALEVGLKDDFKDKDRVIYADTSEIPELQEDYKETVAWLKEAYWLTPNEKREVMKWDRFEDASFDQPLLPSGLMMLSDLILPDPIEPPDDSIRP